MFAVQQETWSHTRLGDGLSRAPIAVVHVVLAGEHGAGDGASPRCGLRSTIAGRALSLGLASVAPHEVVVVSHAADPQGQPELARFACALSEGARRAESRNFAADPPAEPPDRSTSVSAAGGIHA
jgi:hypothetical protein